MREAARETGVVYTSRLHDKEVKNHVGEEVGTFEDFVIDVSDGRVAYAILSGEGFLSKGKLYAVPWDALKLSRDETAFVLDIAKSEVENAPSFDSDNRPNMADRRWGASVHAFFNTTPYWDREGGREYEDEEARRGSYARTSGS